MILRTLSLVRALPRQVQWLIAGSLINKAGSFILPYLSLISVRELGLDQRQAGWLVGVYGGASMVSVILGGVLTDSLGRRRTLLVSLGGSGCVALAMSAAPTATVFVPLLAVFAFLADLYRPASSAMIGDLLPSEQRAGGFAALRVAVNLGFACGMGLGGLLVDWSWRVLVAADGLTTLAFAVLVYRAIHESRPGVAAAGASQAGAAAGTGPAAAPAAGASGWAARPWRDPIFLVFAATSLLFAFAVMSDFTVFPLTATLSAGYPPWVFGLLVGVNGVLITFFEVGATAYLARFRRLRVAALGVLLGGLGLGGTGLVLHWSWFLVCVLLWTAGEILVVPQQSAFAADWAPVAARGRYLSVYSATWSLAIAMNPLVCLPLHAHLGDARFWPLLSVVMLPAMAALLWLDARADRPELLRGATAPARLSARA